MATVTSQEPRARRGAPRQVVFSFDEGAPETRTPAVRGGKGASLADMVALGLPVPPGFTVTTTVARASRQTGSIPKRVAGQIDRAMRTLERQTGKEFGNPDNPLLVSVRSGAQASMPGMMDTVLNVGLNPSTVAGLARLRGEEFALDAYRRFLVQFGVVVLGVSRERLEDAFRLTTAEKLGAHILGRPFNTLAKTCERLRQAIELNIMRPIPDDPQEQLILSLDAVLRSWDSERAQAYRHANNLPSWWGTAATVQAMVFGNRSDASGTGVVFSHDVTTGQPGLYGEFLPNAQGEDVVAGTHTALPISALAEWNEAVYADLKAYIARLVDHLGDVVDVEFTIEDGTLYLLQVRRAKRSALAAATYAVHQVWARSMTREEAVKTVSSRDVESLHRAEFDPEQLPAQPHLRGIPASPGAVVGRVVTSSAQAQEWAAQGLKVVLVSHDTTPDDLPGMLCSEALITGVGGPSSHAALVAREQNLPAVVGVGETLLSQLKVGKLVSVDGTSGVVYAGMMPLIEPTPTKEVKLFLQWHEQFAAYQPRIGFEWVSTNQNVNMWLNDFYLSDLMAVASRGSAVESAASELRTTIHREAAEMLAAYLTVAVAGELRHARDEDCYRYASTSGDTERDTLEHMYSQLFLGRYVIERTRAQEAVVQRLQVMDRSAHGEFFRLAEVVFARDNWEGSYGGEAWAKIAHAGFMFLTGAWSPTVFVDHVFDLRHNGGCLFNKHFMVSSLTGEMMLWRQLNTKKEVRNTTAFYASGLACYGFSPRVEAMYQQGCAARLWEPNSL